MKGKIGSTDSYPRPVAIVPRFPLDCPASCLHLRLDQPSGSVRPASGWLPRNGLVGSKMLLTVFISNCRTPFRIIEECSRRGRAATLVSYAGEHQGSEGLGDSTFGHEIAYYHPPCMQLSPMSRLDPDPRDEKSTKKSLPPQKCWNLSSPLPSGLATRNLALRVVKASHCCFAHAEHETPGPKVSELLLHPSVPCFRSDFSPVLAAPSIWGDVLARYY